MPIAAEDEVARICQELIRIDTSNYGDGSGPGERAAADYVVGLLEEVGLTPIVLESQPGRTSVFVRIPGADRTRPGLCIHGHLDVVPARAADWQVDPFAGEERDGLIWGRGAVDMKGMDAMILASVRQLARAGLVPPRDLVIGFFADEEAGGVYGSGWVVANHPEIFAGVSEAISEVGGYSVTLTGADGQDRRAYLLQTAEKGILWLRLIAHGRAGHGSVPNDENPIVRLAQAIARIDAHEWPQEFIPSVQELLDGLSRLTGISYAARRLDELLAQLGPAAAFVTATLRDTANPTMLEAGYKHNVIPQDAVAAVDARFLPGHDETMLKTLRELAGDHVDVEILHEDISLDSPFHGGLVQAMIAAIRAEDPGAEVLPYCLSGGTDNKALNRLGITGYGFAPLQLPKGLEFAPMFHGIDERVPVESLRFGSRVLGRLIATC
ncbi:MAG: M20/M25/M40 family metallo-hydrolase [Tetrasphaera sp.]